MNGPSRSDLGSVRWRTTRSNFWRGRKTSCVAHSRRWPAPSGRSVGPAPRSRDRGRPRSVASAESSRSTRRRCVDAAYDSSVAVGVATDALRRDAGVVGVTRPRPQASRDRASVARRSSSRWQS